MARSFPAEFQLAAACAMWPSTDRRTEAIRAAASEPLDWPRFLRVAQRHWVVGLAHQGLTEARIAIPPEIHREISARAATLVRKNMAMAAEALRLQRLFDEAKLPVLFVKGSSLAMLVFGNLGLSGSQDIDLLVPREALPAAMELVARAGYRRCDPPPGISDTQLRQLLSLRRDLGFIHQTTGLPIELHWRLFGNPHAMVEDSIMAASREVLLTDTMGLRTLGDEDLFAYLCMHGARHLWNRLKWLADVNALLASATKDRIERLVRAAEERGTGRAAAQTLLLCRRLLGATLPAQLTATLGKSATVRWLEATALQAMTTGHGEQDPHEARFGTTRGSLSTFLLNESWRYRLKELNLHLNNQTDMLTMPLPERLRFLYPFLRLPLWVLRHAAKRSDIDKQTSRKADA